MPVNSVVWLLSRCGVTTVSNTRRTCCKFHGSQSRAIPAERCLTGTGRVGAEQLSFSAATAWFSVERSSAGQKRGSELGF
ncbi:hypothetical protein QL285_049319 [Trifolium repens]|nr:hypothetical protein QL285_049319 [Trifolium repens]